MLICIILVTLAYTASSIAVNYNTNHILEYVKRNNYPIEVHNLNTSDGYELNIHRIPHGLDNNSSSGNRSVILLVHGLQESAEHWMINGNKSLAFLLANLGYDVWMANARGTYHSRGHTRYDTSNPEYWDFSWHEIGLYDHPATIDYILSKTGVSKLSYIGHSQGYFRQYEYQGIENVLRYGRLDPPTYDLDKVTAKIALYYSQNDWLAQPQDVRRLRDELPNVVVDHLVIYEGFNHWDFLFAKDVVELLYNNVIEALSKYNE
ncbi:lysosomal acid lipase-related [Holotrichia oblita]|uniref:Lysosomal acid lipase-related n=1 Tax=Holotrichia oblita TaxID=644536 RepID=A0ACB9TST2_HOLOL|nr:lysosomal acid lipase-related [Holotrichia oblita]